MIDLLTKRPHLVDYEDMSIIMGTSRTGTEKFIARHKDELKPVKVVNKRKYFSYDEFASALKRYRLGRNREARSGKKMQAV